VLEESEGGWKELVKPLGSAAIVYLARAKRPRHPEPEVIDLTMSSPIASTHADLPESEFDDSEFIPERSSSSGYD